MKRYREAFKSTIVMSLLVMYQLIGLLHLAYLPKLTHWPSRTDVIHKSSNTNPPRLLYQRSIHSINDSRKNLIAPFKTLTLFFAFVLSGVITLSTAKIPVASIQLPGLLPLVRILPCEGSGSDGRCQQLLHIRL